MQQSTDSIISNNFFKHIFSLSIKLKENERWKDMKTKEMKGITLVALVVTMIVPYDKNLKHSNINRFHYLQYIKNNKKIENMIKMSLKTCLFLYLK